MRRIITAITAFAMALSMLATALAAPASAAVPGYLSDYFGESAFLALAPGQAGQFAVGFNNTGATGWQLGTSSQVDLGICLADKTTCNVSSPNAAWASNWYSSIAYATQSTSFVAPGQTGWFVYGVRAPAASAQGDSASFNGDLVLHATLQQIRPQGYYQTATVSGTATVPTALTVSPTFQGKQIGQTATLTANVTADPAAGSTTRQPVANVEVTFQAPATAGVGTNPGNPALTATAITDSNGNATWSYTRNNPGTDTVTAYVTAAPTVRGQGTVSWGTAASTISVTPDTAVTMPNTTVGSSSSCRTYSVSAQDLNGNGIASLAVNFLENLPTSANTAASGANADAMDGGATIGGAAVANGTNYTLALGGAGVGTPGTGTFDVCGAGSTKTVTPVAWQDNNPADNYFNGELGDAGGSITFQSRKPTITVTPDGTASFAAGTEEVYTVQAADQFGTPFTGNLVISSVEYTDNLIGTSTTAFVAWYDNRATTTGVPTTTPTASCGVTSGATASANVATPQTPGGTTQAQLVAPNSSGTLTFALCSTSATTATGIAFQDKDTNYAFASDEPKDTGATVTWAAAAATACTLKASKTTLPTGDANTTTADAVGDVTYTLTLTDQSGNAFNNTGSAVFTITNTGANAFVATGGTSTNTSVASGGTNTQTNAIAGASSSTITLDSNAATSASVSATFTPTSGVGTGPTVTCGPATNTWILATDAQTLASGSTIQGTVIFVDLGASNGGAGCTAASTTDGCGAYVVQTSATGNFYVTFDVTNDTFKVVGTTATGPQFEAALSVGDVITVTTAGAQSAGAYSHQITTNAP